MTECLSSTGIYVCQISETVYFSCVFYVSKVYIKSQLLQANIELFLMFCMLQYVGESLILSIYFKVKVPTIEDAQTGRWTDK